VIGNFLKNLKIFNLSSILTRYNPIKVTKSTVEDVVFGTK